MDINAGSRVGRGGDRWTVVRWAGAGAVLLIPLLAMLFTGEVAWTVKDFIFAATLLFGTVAVYELAARMTTSTAYRAGVGVAILAAFFVGAGWLFLTAANEARARAL